MLLMERNVQAYGINTELKTTMDFAKLALKMKIIKKKELKKTLTITSYLIVNELANKKIFRFKRLNIAQLDIVKDAMMI